MASQVLSSAMSFFGVNNTVEKENDAPSMTTTENGSLAHSGTGSACLDLFINSVRGLSSDYLNEKLNKAWSENPETVLQIICNNRDCRNGKGERDLFFKMALWLRKNYWKTYLLNLENFINLGRFKDLINISVLVLSEDLDKKYYELRVLAKYLAEDVLRLNNDKKEGITLCAKWCPTRDNIATRPYNITSKFIKILFSCNFDKPDGWTELINKLVQKYGNRREAEIYRKHMLVPLRKHINIVESLMSSNNWTEINLQHVPAKAIAKYRKTFKKHIPEELTAFLTKVSKGDAKINISGQTPYDIIHKYFVGQKDNVLETQWNEMLKNAKNTNQLRNTVSVVDVSGSMDGIPREVAIALGLFTSLIPDESDPFYKRLITFSKYPEFHTVKGDTLHEMINNIIRMRWGMNTNFNAVFRLILDVGKSLKLPQERMPERVIVYTDMQFDKADGRGGQINFEEIKAMYKDSGYKMPQMVFWNLRASLNNAMPVTKDEYGTAYLSGYSAELLKGLMDGVIDPISIMINILSEYNVIVAPEDLFCN
jgi:hypothetical protein